MPSQDICLSSSGLMGWLESYQHLAVQHKMEPHGCCCFVFVCLFVSNDCIILTIFPIGTHIPLWCFALRLGLFVVNSQSWDDGNVLHLWCDWCSHSASLTAATLIILGLRKGNENVKSPIYFYTIYFSFVLHDAKISVHMNRVSLQVFWWIAEETKVKQLH